jgi:hypothetical protein
MIFGHCLLLYNGNVIHAAATHLRQADQQQLWHSMFDQNVFQLNNCQTEQNTQFIISVFKISHVEKRRRSGCQRNAGRHIKTKTYKYLAGQK